MCGIAGFFNPQGRLPENAGGILSEMGIAIRHRGPDDNGIYLDEKCGFSFQRLSIIDLATGHQPMVSNSGKRVIVFNGEIYNFKGLKSELINLGYEFKTNSDAEVILAGYELWGEAILGRLRGMFAIAIYDKEKNEIFMARDHTGIKPLYYTRIADTVVFASEIKAFLKFPGFKPEINLAHLPGYMSFLWVPAPNTMFKNVSILEPAYSMKFNRDGAYKKQFWQPDLLTQDAFSSETEWIDWLDAEMGAVVKEQMLSDVPLGALLSGGVDSSLIVALMNRVSPKPVTTYTTGFEKADLARDVIGSDLEYARLAAGHLKVDYHELILRPDVVDLLPKIVWHMDEPVADPAAVTTYLICQAVKPSCTVMLSGVGGDEIFGGYPRYRAGLLAERYRQVPRFLRKLLVEYPVNMLGGGNNRFVRNARKFIKSASLPFKESYFGYLTYYAEKEMHELLKQDFSWSGIFSRHDSVWNDNLMENKLQTMMNLDLKTFLPNLNLMYTDKMSAAAAVEIRVPFLDHLLIEQAARMPANLKINGQVQKYILKKTADRYLPREIVWRRKAGFGAPIGAWLKGQAREMMLDLLSETTVNRRGHFHYPALKAIIDDHLSGREYNANQLWQLLTLELWQQEFIDKT
jgi:asparagine synthase (glutamine-hydrolysing)